MNEAPKDMPVAALRVGDVMEDVDERPARIGALMIWYRDGSGERSTKAYTPRCVRSGSRMKFKGSEVGRHFGPCPTNAFAIIDINADVAVEEVSPFEQRPENEPLLYGEPLIRSGDVDRSPFLFVAAVDVPAHLEVVDIDVAPTEVASTTVARPYETETDLNDDHLGALILDRLQRLVGIVVGLGETNEIAVIAPPPSLAPPDRPMDDVDLWGPDYEPLENIQDAMASIGRSINRATRSDGKG